MTTIIDNYALLYNNTGKSWWGCLAWVADGIDVHDDAGAHIDWRVIGYRIDWGDGSIEWVYKDLYGVVYEAQGEAPDVVDWTEVRAGWVNRFTNRPGEGPGSYYVASVYHPYLAAGTYDIDVSVHYWDYFTGGGTARPGIDTPSGSEARGSYTHVAATTARPARTNWGSKYTLGMHELNEAYDPEAPDNAFFVSAPFADLRTGSVGIGPGFIGVTAQPPWGRWRGGYWEFQAEEGVGLGNDIIAALNSNDRPEWSDHLSEDTLWLPYRQDQLTRLDDGGPVPLWHENPTYAGSELDTWYRSGLLGVDAGGMLVVSVQADDSADPDFLRTWRLILVDPADRSVVTELVPPLMPTNTHTSDDYGIWCLLSDEEVLLGAHETALWVWNFVTDDLWLLNANVGQYLSSGYVRATADGGVLVAQQQSVYRVQRNGRDSSPTGKLYDIAVRALPWSNSTVYDSDYGGYRPFGYERTGLPDVVGEFAHSDSFTITPDDTDPDVFYMPMWIEPDIANQRNLANRFQGPAWSDGWDSRNHTRWVTAIYRGNVGTSTWTRVAWLQHPYPWWHDDNYDRVRHLYPAQFVLPTNIPAGNWLPEPNPPSMVATMAVLGGPRFYIDEPVTVTMHANMDDTGLLVDSKFTMDWGDYDDSDERDDVATEHTYTWAFHDTAIQGFFGRMPTEDDPIVLTLRAIPRDPVTDRGGIPATATISLYPHRILTDVGPQHARFNPRPALGGQ